MTPIIKNNIRDWILGILGISVTILTIFATLSFNSGSKSEKIEHLEKQQIKLETTLKTLNDSKVGRAEYQLDRQELREILFRMEDKIDKLNNR